MTEPALVGRDSELHETVRAIEQARNGQSCVLVVQGGPGLGKTALLDRAVANATRFQVIRARAVESERNFPYAGLQILCSPMLDQVQNLRADCRQTLAAALGSGAGEIPDPCAVGAATLSLLWKLAEQRPLLCVIDDAQWLDRASAQAMRFFARRLGAHPITLLVAKRHHPLVYELDGLPEVQVGRLSPVDSRALLESTYPGPMDHAVRERILTEARGIPLAIQELKSLTSPAVLGTRLGVASWEDDVSSLTEQFLSEISQLSRESRTLLLAAAADPYGETSVFWRAAASLGISADDFVPLETGGYLHVESLVLFPRPALRLAVYRAASDDERRSVHRALAKATESAADPTRHIWHLAHAALRPDEGIAEQLESCLTVARDRGGIAAVAAFLEKATYLTGEPKRRSKRALAAATALNQVSTGAARLLQLVDPASIDSPTRCRLQEQQALMAMAAHRADDAADLLVSAAVQAEPHSADLARQMYLEALTAAIFAGSLGFLQSSVDVSKAAAAGLPPVTSGRADEQLLDALVARHTQGQQASLEPLRIALRNAERFPADGEKWWRWLACLATTEIWDDQAWEAQTAIASRLACETGALTVLARILDNQATANLFFGNFSAASALISQAQRVYAATGTPLPAHAALLLQAWTGQKSAWAFLKDARRQAAEQGEGRTLAVSNLAAAVLLNSSGRYDDALAMLRGCTDEDDLGLSGWMLLELIEAAARARDQESARKALDRLGERTEACDTSWAAGSYASARAMLASGTAADELFREALHHLERTRVGTQLARTQLLYGEWLRRQGSRLDARRQLRAAYQSFTTMGAAAFAVRAQQELFATGEKARARTSAGDRKLTPQEARIAYLARDGLSNPAIGARMFVSPRTVEYHLHKVFSKLGVTTRGELHLVLPTQATSADA